MSRLLIQKAKQILTQEKGTIHKPGGYGISFALAYPNTYYVGMSNLGFQTVYSLLNQIPDVLCERTFLPQPEEQPEFRRTNTPLFSLESQKPIREFDLLGFSISYELDYINILKILNLAKINLIASQRKQDEPIVIAGGPCATFNPEPLSDFIDIFVIGEAEEVLEELIDVFREAKKQPASRQETINKFAQLDGLYVPQLYHIHYHQDGTIKQIKPKNNAKPKIKRLWVKDLNNFSTHSIIITPNTEFRNMYLIEIARGCPRGCRFCVGGYIYRLPRIRSPQNILTTIDEGLKHTKRIGLVGAAVSDYPYITEFSQALLAKNAQISVSSLYINSFSQPLAQLLAKSHQHTITFAPETASQRLQKILNKPIKNNMLIDKINLATHYGLNHIRLYFMIGLPSETQEDIQAIVELVDKIIGEATKVAKVARIAKITLSIAPFVPKPHTPFQWTKMLHQNSLTQRLNSIKQAFKKTKQVAINFESTKWSAIQGILARGDRRIGTVLAQAYQLGGTLGAWRQAFEITGLDPGFYLYRERKVDEILPWDHIDTGVNKDFLWQEYRKSQKLTLTPECPAQNCQLCGICEG